MIKDDLAFRRATSRLLSLIVALFVSLTIAPAALAQTNSGLLIVPFPTEETVVSETGAAFLESGHIAEPENDEDFQLSLYGSYGRFRLVPGKLESPRIGYDFTYLDLDTSFDGLPKRLVDQSVAVGFPIGQTGDWIFGASLGVGYAGDGGFGDGDAWYGLASLAAFQKLSETAGLVYILDFDGNRTFLPDIPLPGFAYIRELKEQGLSMTLGVPLSSIRWQPSDRFSLEVAFYLPEDLRIDVGYEVVDHLTVFGRIRQQAEGFFVDGLPENHDRILFEQRRAEAGVRYQPTEEVKLDLAVGYAFGGEFNEGFDSRDPDEIADISDEPYVRAGVELRF